MTDDTMREVQEQQEAMDRRVEDVARTLHFMESRHRDDYFNSDFPWTWENEGWYAAKADRNWARHLIGLFDKRASDAP